MPRSGGDGTAWDKDGFCKNVAFVFDEKENTTYGVFTALLEFICFQNTEKLDTFSFIMTYKLYSNLNGLFKDLQELYYRYVALNKPLAQAKVITFLKDFFPIWCRIEKKWDPLWALVKHVAPEEEKFFQLILLREKTGKLAPIPSLARLPGPNSILFQVDVRHIAEQLTQFEFEIFQQLTPPEFYNNAFTKKSKEKSAPVMTYLSRRSNQITWWVATEIVNATKKNIQHGVQVMKFFISIAEQLLKIRNYNCFAAVITGITNPSVTRLKKLKEASQPHKEKVKKFLSMITFENNFKAYRELEANSSTPKDPLLPYLAVYLRDITFINDGNQDYSKDNPSLINFEKLKLLGTRVGKLISFAHCPSRFPVIPELRELIKSLYFLEDDELFNRSCLVEPSLCADDENKDKPTVKDKDAKTWTAQEVADILQEYCPDEDFSTVLSKNLNGKQLMEITKQETLADYGFVKLGVRIRVFTFIKRLRKFLFESPCTWSGEDVSAWLSWIEMGEYAKSFQENSIVGSLICDLSAKDLINLGVRKYSHRRLLLKHIQGLKKKIDPFAVRKAVSHDVVKTRNVIREETVPVSITSELKPKRASLPNYASEGKVHMPKSNPLKPIHSSPLVISNCGVGDSPAPSPTSSTCSASDLCPNTVTFDCKLNGENVQKTIPSNISFSLFKEELNASSMDVLFYDEDNDLVTVTPNSWDLVLALAASRSQPLPLEFRERK